MAPRQFIALGTACFSLFLVGSAVAQQRAADGVALNAEGLPQYSTFSLCAIDPATGQSGAAVTTRVPFVGRAVPQVRAGVGAVCTQASTMVEYGAARARPDGERRRAAGRARAAARRRRGSASRGRSA